MQTYYIAVFTCLLTATACFGQNRAMRAGSLELEMLLGEHGLRMAEEAETWRTSKKITLLEKEKIPNSPVGQNECLSPKDLHDGSVGRLDYWQYKVMQVIGPNDVLLRIDNPNIPAIWLAGYSTKGLVDGDQVRLVGLIEVDGTKSYTTVEGVQKTVRVVRLVSPERMAEVEAAAKAKAEEVLFRTWTDKSGKHSFIGKFVTFKDSRVQLVRKDDEKTVEVRMQDLSKEDQKWVRDELKRRKEAKKPSLSGKKH